MPITNIRLDDTDAFAWSSITTVRDDADKVTTRTTDYDNGDQRIESFTYENDLFAIQRIQLFDHSDTKTYESVDETYFILGNEEVGEIIRIRAEAPYNRVVVFDDGIVQTSTYGYESAATHLREDTKDINDWDSISQVFDVDGNLTQMDTLYDDGSHTRFIASPGAQTLEVRLDADNAEIGLYSFYYDANGLVTQEFYWDANVRGGLSTRKQFEDGQLTSISESDNYSDAYDFAERFTSFDVDTGHKELQSTQNDDGTYDLIEYQQVNGETKVWRTTARDADRNVTAMSENQYDADGQLVETKYSDQAVRNGMVFTRTFKDGVIVEFIEDDTVSEALGFNIRQTTYDDSGVITSRFTQDDNGVQRTETYVDGQRSAVELSDPDNVESWHSRVTAYDENGQIEFRQLVTDDDEVREDNYIDGVLSFTEQSDTANVQSWHSIVTLYDESGVIESRETLQDDGVLRFDQFEDGKRVSVTRDDQADVENWNRIETTYDDAGAVAVHRVEYDNADVFIFDNVNALRIFRDGDGDQTWEFKVTDLAAADGPETTVYDNINDLAVDIATDYFDF